MNILNNNIKNNNIDKDKYNIDNTAKFVLKRATKICLIALIMFLLYLIGELYIKIIFMIDFGTEYRGSEFTFEFILDVAGAIYIFGILTLYNNKNNRRINKKVENLEGKKSSQNKKDEFALKKFNLTKRLLDILRIRRNSNSKENKFKNTYYNLEYLIIVCINILILMIVFFLLCLSGPYIPYGDIRVLQVHLILIFQVIYTSIIILRIRSFYRKDIWSEYFDKKIIKITINLYHFIIYLSFSILFPFIFLVFFRDIYLNYYNLWEMVLFTLMLILIALINGSLTYYFFYKKAKKKLYLNSNPNKAKGKIKVGLYKVHLIILTILYNFVGLYVPSFFMMYPFMVNFIVNIIYALISFSIIYINCVIILRASLRNKIVNKTNRFIMLYSISLFLIGIGSMIFNLIMGLIFNNFGLYGMLIIYMTFNGILIGIYIISNLTITLHNICKIKFEISKIVLEDSSNKF
ncbi:MAG: hypothetical protein ACTSRP_20355 [Candidatus Helarchaeota archaeon]